jgi:hypothetical protein
MNTSELYIKELKIKVRIKPVITKIKDIKIPEGYRLLTFQEAVYIYDNKLLKDFPCKEWDLIQQFSKLNLDKGYKYSALYSLWGDGRLDVVGYCFDDSDDGYAFRVRFCKDVKE